MDEVILAAYLAAANTRRFRKALEPFLGERHLSKNAVSRVVARLKMPFESWKQRDLSEQRHAILFLGGFHPKVRLARRIVGLPVLAVLGVAEDGNKTLVSLRGAASEAESQWGGLIADPERWGLASPLLLVVGGDTGLFKALEAWPGVRVQRSTRHKLSDLEEHYPLHARAEMKRDSNRILHAQGGLAARKAYEPFVAKGPRLFPGRGSVARGGGKPTLDLLPVSEEDMAVASDDEPA